MARADIVTMRDGKYHIISNGAIAVRAGKIVWMGEQAAMPALAATKTVKLDGGIITPGLVDCHTHLVFGATAAASLSNV